MSIFNNDIIEVPVYVGNIYDIEIEAFQPDMFYRWVWKEKGIKYPAPVNECIPKDTLRSIIIDKLENIPAQLFEEWVKESKLKSTKHIRKYFKKILKRQYMREFSTNENKNFTLSSKGKSEDKDVFVITVGHDEGAVFNFEFAMYIKFYKKL